MKLERIQAPSGGMNTEAAPDYVPGNQAPLLVNLLPGRPGKAVLRGGFTKYYNDVNGLLSHGNADGNSGPFVWVYHNNSTNRDILLVRTAGMSPAAPEMAWTVPSSPAVSPVSSVAIRSDRHVQIHEFVYGDVLGTTNEIQLGRWDPTGNTLVRYTNAPSYFTGLKSHLSRLFVLGGFDAGPPPTGQLRQFGLRWSDPIASGTALPDTIAAWQDDVSGLANLIEVATDDWPVAMAKAGRWLVLIGQRRMYVLTGDAPSNFAVRPLTSEFRCLDEHSIVESENGFFFLSDRGYCFCDGSDVRVVSDPVNALIAAANPGASGAYPVTAAMLPGGFIALAVAAASASLAKLLLYHIESGTWAQADTALLGLAGAYTGNLRVYRSPLYTLLHDGYHFIDASFLTRPDAQAAATPAAAGQDSDGAASPTRYTIVPKWYSRLARLGGPGQMAHVKRILLDFVLKAQNTSRTGLRVEAHDGYGNLLGTAMTTANARLDANRQRFQAELYAETDTIQLQVSRDQESAVGGGPPGITALEFLDAAVEFDDGRPRPSR